MIKYVCLLQKNLPRRRSSRRAQGKQRDQQATTKKSFEVMIKRDIKHKPVVHTSVCEMTEIKIGLQSCLPH